MPKPLTKILREYDLTDAMRRDRRSLLAVVLLAFLDYRFGVLEKVIIFDVDIGQVFSDEARRYLYIILLIYFGIVLAARYFGILFSGRLYDIEQWARPLMDNARQDFEKPDKEIILNDEEAKAKKDEEFEGFMQGMQDRIDAELVTDRYRYTAALAFKTFFEIYLPLALALLVLFWTFVLQYMSD